MFASVPSATAGPSISKMSPAAKTASDACVHVAIVPLIANTAVANAEPFFVNVNVVDAVAAVLALA